MLIKSRDPIMHSIDMLIKSRDAINRVSTFDPSDLLTVLQTKKPELLPAFLVLGYYAIFIIGSSEKGQCSSRRSRV